MNKYQKSDENCGCNIDKEEVENHGFRLFCVSFISSEFRQEDSEVLEDKLDENDSDSDSYSDSCLLDRLEDVVPAVIVDC